MRTETDPVTGTQAGAVALGRDCTVGTQEASERARRERDRVPIHFVARTRPSDVLRGRDDAIGEGSVESGIVRDEDSNRSRSRSNMAAVGAPGNE